MTGLSHVPPVPSCQDGDHDECDGVVERGPNVEDCPCDCHGEAW